MPISYYAVIVVLGIGNLALAVIAYFQRSKQIRGNRLREHQLLLAEARNELAEQRLERLNDQLALLSEIRDALCGGRGSPARPEPDLQAAVVGLPPPAPVGARATSSV